ncbi:unnamed protein product [Nesidiocoris tenuis]|uniref:Uncharacterized protein n=1 Tax=Nesidiocoris tenuis TaxID=355587 RepID=A0A6H5GGQ3_9HEMI|nr:unnamed protein product [Nesidiocoris tenuis]
MEFGLKLLMLFATVALTAIASFSLSSSMMTDHWETIVWDPQEVDKLVSANFTELGLEAKKYLDDRVTSVTVRKGTGLKVTDVARVFLVPMHGGIWTLCVSLTEIPPQFRRNSKFCCQLCSWSYAHHGYAAPIRQPRLRPRNAEINSFCTNLYLPSSAPWRAV